MTDDRDKRRFSDPLHPPEYGGVVGELDSRDDETAPLRPRRKVEVDPQAFEPDERWEAFAEMQREVASCKADRLAREKRAKWLDPIRKVSAGGVIVALIWTLRALDARSVEAERARRRNEEFEALKVKVESKADATDVTKNAVDIRALQDWRIQAEVFLGVRTRNRYPRTDADRSDP